MIMEAVRTPLRSTGRRSPRHAAAPVPGRPRPLIAALALIAVLVPLHRWWAAQVLLVPLLFIVPGVILLRALRIPGAAISSFPVYIPCASIVVMFASGLAIDMVGPLVGLGAPLRALPSLAAFEVTCLALLAACKNAPAFAAIEWHSLLQPARLGWPLVLPVVAAGGALRLNSGHGNNVALAAAVSFVTLLIAAAVLAPRFTETLLAVVLYAVGLAVGWSYSLRGDGVYGFDISTEYQRMQETILTGVWHPAHPNDAYGAMLSVTIMPTELHTLSGVAGLLVLKVVYPMIYALFPMAIFHLARRVLSPRWAFIAAAFIMGQYAYTEIISVARQEIALVLFVALISAMLDRSIQWRSQWALVILLGLAMDLSHYSTTYMTITLIGLALPLQWAVSWFRAIPRITGAMAVAFIAVFSGAVIWYVPVTQSDSHLVQVAQAVQAQGLNLLPNRAPGSSLLSAYLQGNAEKPIPAAQYEQLVSKYYELSKPNIITLSDARSARYALRDSAVPEPPVKWHPGYDVLTLGMLVLEQLTNVLAALGGLLMVLQRKASLIARQIGLLALVVTLLLTLIRFSGTLAVAYGQERAQLQGLALLAISLCWGIQGLAGVPRAGPTRVLTVTAAGLAVILVNTSYLTGAVLGGGTSANLTNSGPAFEYFDITAPELASAQWLGAAVERGQLVYADEYGQLRLAATTGIQKGLLLDITPQTLDQNAWVYASRTNVVNGRAFALYNEDLFASYAFPSNFLDVNYDLVYTNGSSEVFHR